MKKFKKMLPYLIVNVIAFYLTPFLIKDTGSGMLILLIGFPIICFIVALIYGIKNSFQAIRKAEQRKADNHRKIVVGATFETFLQEPRRYSETQIRQIMQVAFATREVKSCLE